MKLMIKESVILLLLLSLSPIIQAQEKPNFFSNEKIGIGIKGGTTGVSLDITKSLSRTVNLRAAYNFNEFEANIAHTDVRYDSTFKQQSFSLMLDWHPGNHGFRISAGAYKHFNNEISITAKPVGNYYTFNNTPYDGRGIGSVTGEINFGTGITPYIGIGWGNASKTGNKFSYIFDLGVQFQDSVFVEKLTVTNCTLRDQLCNELNSSMTSEKLKIEDNFDEHLLWPVINFGFAIQL